MLDSLCAFIDESWNEKFFVLAGFLVTGEALATFLPDWTAALHEPPAIEYFKMNEVNGKTKGQFVSYLGSEWEGALGQVAHRLIAVLSNL